MISASKLWYWRQGNYSFLVLFIYFIMVGVTMNTNVGQDQPLWY